MAKRPLDSSPSTPDRMVRAFHALAQQVQRIGSNCLYVGNPDADGSWRAIVIDTDLVFQRRIAGTWTTKHVISG